MATIRMTSSIIQKMVEDVIKDIIVTKYEDQIIEAVQKDAYDQMPKEVKAIYDNEQLREKYLVKGNYNHLVGGANGASVGTTLYGRNQFSYYNSFSCQAFGVPINNYHNRFSSKPNNAFKLSEEAHKEVTRLVELRRDQYNKIEETRQKVTSALKGCSTFKQVRERYSYLAKYLPDESRILATMQTTPTVRTPVEGLKSQLVEAGWKREEPST